ncbi:hypothetical protein [Streptomyces halobius]|uniref:Uncharacterized protein n=1 Tax=Streptomyces halobius TaxID=2879846 RepID=A0ABY4M500_9ACTN|nr:hypothetical protein [Streptomyces halobius]UQA92832.1 hypothetical protein K9S39_14205 [Streptomyces halobius]
MADRNPGVGRRGVSKAVQELEDAGYYFRRTIRDPETGRVWTETFVYDTPQDSPFPASPGTGAPGAGSAGTLPTGVKNPVEEPSPVAQEAASAPAVNGREGEAPKNTDYAGRGAALLARLATADSRLVLGTAETLLLAPLAGEWLERGASELEVRNTLTAGLPPVVHSAAAILRDRLTRKLPAPRTRCDAAAPAAPLPECAECAAPLPRHQETGICGQCSGVASAPFPENPTVGLAAFRAARRSLRAAQGVTA